MNTHNYNSNLGNPEEIMHNYSLGREDERLFTLLKKEDGSCLLTSYRENHSIVRTFHETKMITIGYDRLMPENEKNWKKEIEWLHSLSKCGKLDFDSKETKTAFLKECKLLGIK